MRHPDTALFNGGVLTGDDGEPLRLTYREAKEAVALAVASATSAPGLPAPGTVLRHRASGREFSVLSTRTNTDGTVGAHVRYDDGGTSWTWAVDAETWWEEWRDVTLRQTTPDDEPVPATVSVIMTPTFRRASLLGTFQKDTESRGVARDATEFRGSFIAKRGCVVDGIALWLDGHRVDMPMQSVRFGAGDTAMLSAKMSPSVGAMLDDLVAKAERDGGTYSTAPVAVTPITLDSVKATIDELSKANDTWRESDDELRARIAHKWGTKYSMGIVCAYSGKRLDLVAEQFGIKRLADDRPIDGGTWVPEPSFMAPRWRYREAFGKTPPVATSTALPTQYRRAPNGRGYRVLDVDSERALMRQDDGLRVTAPLGVVAAWTLEDGPETMTAAEQHEARGRLALEWPRAGETRADTLRRVTGDVEWARSTGAQHCKRTRATGAWEGAVMWEALK